MMISEGFVITIIIITTTIIIPTVILPSIPLAICSTPLRKSSGVPDSPCSVASDGSGSWIGIPRVMIAMRIMMRMTMMRIMRGAIVIYITAKVKKNWIDVVTVPLLMAYTTRLV